MKGDFRSALDELVIGDLPDEGAPPDTGPPPDERPLSDTVAQDVTDAIEDIRRALDRLEENLDKMMQPTEGGTQ